MIEIFSWFVVLVILATSGILLLSRDWRVQLGTLAVQYLAALWLVAQHLPLAMGSAKLVTGWMVVAALGMTRLGLTTLAEDETVQPGPRAHWFPIILTGIVALASAGATPRIEAVIPGLGLQVIAGSLILIGSGLIQLSITSDILRVIIGLLSMLAGFEIIYAGVESSILVTGLLAVTNLGLGLVGCYLLLAGSAQDETAFEEEV